MEARLQKWGNSNGIRIPNKILKELNWKTNDKLDIYEDNNTIVISKKINKHVTLKERIKEFNKLPKDEQGSVSDYDWGEDVQVEKWD